MPGTAAIHGKRIGDELILDGIGVMNIDQDFYTKFGFGQMGLMPNDMRFSKANPGIDGRVMELLGTMKSGNAIISLPTNYYEMDFLYSVKRETKDYIIRQYLGPGVDIFILYHGESDAAKLKRAIGVTLKKDGISLGFLGVRPSDSRQDYGSTLLAGIERYCSEKTSLLTLSVPLKDEIPFFVKMGYRILKDCKGTLAKVLKPGFDEGLLLP